MDGTHPDTAGLMYMDTGHPTLQYRGMGSTFMVGPMAVT